MVTMQVKDFESHIQSNKPVIVEFYAEWSQGSLLMNSVLEELRETVGDRANVIRIDIDKDRAYAKDYEVFNVPTFILFKNGKVFWRKNGIAPVHEILEHLNLLME